MRKLLLLLALFLPLVAQAELPKELLDSVAQSRVDALPALEKFLHEDKLNQFQKDKLYENLLKRVNRGGNLDRLPAILDKLLDDQPSNANLEQILRVLYFAKRWKKKQPLPGYEAYVDRIARHAATDPRAGAVRRLLQLIYQDDFPEKISRRRASTEEAGVHALGSTYTDDATGEKHTEIGTASLVDIPSLSRDHYFLVTAAHLLGGEKPFVRIGGQELAILPEDIVSDNGRDISLVRLPKSGTPAFRYDGDSFLPSQTFRDLLAKNEVPLHSVYSGVGITLENMKFHTDQPEKESERGNYHAILDAEISRYSTVQPMWAQPNARQRASTDVGRHGVPELVNRGETIHAQFEATPGMSGAFLLEENVNDGAELKGVLTQYNYYFGDTYFTHVDFVKELVRQFQAGRRGALTATHWRMKNGLTYRRFRDGYEEANFLDFPAGNGLAGDAGNGVHGDPGNGVHGDPGNGVHGDPGIEKCLEQLLADPNIRNIAVLQAALLQGFAKSPQEIFSRYGIRPGMKWQGKSILGIKATPKKDPSGAFLLYANPAAAQFMLEGEKDYTFEPVLDGADLSEFALAKARHAFGKTPSQMLGKEEVRLKATTPYYDYGDIRIKKDGIDLDFILDYGTETPPTTKYNLDMTLREGERPNKFLPIHLDAAGRLPGQKNFLPIIEVKNKLGEPVRVDIRQLYFTDLSQVAQELDHYSGHELPRDADEALTQSREIIQIPYRNAATAVERSATLLPRDCSLDSRSENWIAGGKYTRSRCLKLSDEWK